MTTKSITVLNHPFLTQGFRPFFFGAAVYAIISLILWISALSFGLDLPTAMPALVWHKHEMIFGFLSAVLVGFLLTAIPNWTGRLPYEGARLAALFGLWLLGRIGIFSSNIVGLPLAALIDLSFLISVFFLVCREIIVGQNWRNIPVLVGVFTLMFSHVLFYLDLFDYAPAFDSWQGLPERLAIAGIACLLALIGGRITPSFTHNWLKKHGIDNQVSAMSSKIDHLALLVTVVTVLCWVIFGPTIWLGWLFLLASFFHFVRLFRWHGFSTIKEPLLFTLHCGYFWLGLAFLVSALSMLGESIDMELFTKSASMHSFTIGAAGVMMVSVMMRATLGHSGFSLKADYWMVLIMVAVNLSALSRILVDQFSVWQHHILIFSALFWVLTFTLFLIRFSHLFFAERRPRDF